MMHQQWRDASHRAQELLRQRDREHREMQAENETLRRALATERRERAAERKEVEERGVRQRRKNAHQLAEQLASVGFRLAMARYAVGGGDGRVHKPRNQSCCPGLQVGPEHDPDKDVGWGGIPEGETVLDLQQMTASGRKTGSLRLWLSPDIQRRDVGDYLSIVGERRNALLVRLTAKPVQIHFGDVAIDHVTKEGLSDLFGLEQARAILRRIISLQTQQWFQDDDKVWWLEWDVVAEI